MALVNLPAEGCSLKTIEREAIVMALMRTGGCQKEAAQLLQISPRVLNYKIRWHGIPWRIYRGQFTMAGTPLTPADEDALLSDLAEADRHVRQMPRADIDRAYIARLLRHALRIVEPKDTA